MITNSLKTNWQTEQANSPAPEKRKAYCRGLLYRYLTVQLVCSVCILTAHASGDTLGLATYIANEGIMIESGDAKILFDPLFEYPHDYYQVIPEGIKTAILNGTEAFEGIDAVLISHFHADHFSPEMILQLMRQQEKVQLFATGQAVSAMYQLATEADQTSFERIHRIDMALGDDAKVIEIEQMVVEAVLIPHSGWPSVHQHVENLSYRVTLKDKLTVVHMGDADPDPSHFNSHDSYWTSRKPDAAFPPYWFFLSRSGNDILDQYIRPTISIGVHIPADPENQPEELLKFDVFKIPGESKPLFGPAGSH